MRLVTNYPTRDLGREVDYEAMKRNAYRDQGVVIVRLDDPRLTWDQKEIVKQVGTKLYGQRRA